MSLTLFLAFIAGANLGALIARAAAGEALLNDYVLLGGAAGVCLLILALPPAG